MPASVKPSISSGKLRQIFLAALFATPLMLHCNLFAEEEPLEHPYIEPRDIKPETCLTCHPEKKQGKFVHTAVRMGCENCHLVFSQKNKTAITLAAAGGDLCSKCHEAEQAPVLHGPYKNGQCLVCHDPHVSDFKAQTRAEGNSLCLLCHASRSVRADTVSLFGVQEISRAVFAEIPKIELDPTLRFGHPRPGHPVAGIADPLREGEMMSCLSCHTPHASAQANLLLVSKAGGDLCGACHQALDRQKKVKIQR